MPSIRLQNRYECDPLSANATPQVPDHPFNIMRRYYLTSEDRGVSGDTSYALVITNRCEIVVQATKRHEQRYKAPEIYEIPARDFATTTVNGRPLVDIVIQKLNEILPDSN